MSSPCCCAYIVTAVSLFPPLMPYNRAMLYIVQFLLVGIVVGPRSHRSRVWFSLFFAPFGLLIRRFTIIVSWTSYYTAAPPRESALCFFFFLLRRMPSFVLYFVVNCTPITACLEWAPRSCPSAALLLHSFAKKVNLRFDLLRSHAGFFPKVEVLPSMSLHPFHSQDVNEDPQHLHCCSCSDQLPPICTFSFLFALLLSKSAFQFCLLVPTIIFYVTFSSVKCILSMDMVR